MIKYLLPVLLVAFLINPACSWNSSESDGGQPADSDGYDGSSGDNGSPDGNGDLKEDGGDQPIS
ncbi:MAG: hypothetical protein JRJ87_20335 [Deltaproteobacteria bacterium]|nr:hypothetical protein [Deltaproteobacteria bacterium]